MHECSCQCHYSPTDESVVDWEKEFDGWANNVVEHDSERVWVKTFIRNLLTSKEAQHKAEVETARKEERERTAGFLKVILSGKENVYLRNDLENLYRDITKETP